MNTVELDITGMSCGSCVKHVKQALEAVSGVTYVEVDLTSGRARIDGDLQAGAEPLIAALAQEDYSAVIATSTATAQPAKTTGCQGGQGNKSGCCCG